MSAVPWQVVLDEAIGLQLRQVEILGGWRLRAAARGNSPISSLSRMEVLSRLASASMRRVNCSSDVAR